MIAAEGSDSPRALIFDWDNTLVDTWELIHHALGIALTACGMEPWSLEETQARVRQSGRDSFPKVFGEKAAFASDIYYRTYRESHLDKLRAIAGAESFLRDAAASGRYVMSVVSNKQGTLLRSEAAHLGWDGYFHSLVGAADAPRDKPSREPVDLALKGSGIGAGAAVWFVGDTDIDLVTAYEADCFPVLLRPQAPRKGEFEGHDPHRHFADFDALRAALLD